MKRENSSCYFFIQEPKIPTATNKTFLANTIKNTSSYNNALRRMEAKEGLRKKSYVKENLEKRVIISASSRKQGRSKSATGESTSKEYKEATSESYRRLGKMVDQSKLKTQKKSLISLEEVLGRNVDPGPYGPIKSNIDNEPNSSLPQKCPW